MFRKISLLVLCCIASLTIVAQNTRLVKGVVFSDQEIPLKGATITLIGMPGSTQTDENGLFEFSVSPYAKQVEATCEGYLPQKAEIDGTYLIFKLKVDKKYAKQKAKEEEEARLAAQKEAEAKAKEEARIAAQKAEEQARIAAQKDAIAKAEEEARIAAQKAEEQARIAAQREAEAKAKAEEEARIAAQKAEEQARIAAEKAERDSIAKIAAEERRIEYAKHQSGFTSMIDVSYRLPFNALSGNIGANYIAGYRINNTLLVGAGVGINYFLNSQPSQLSIDTPCGVTLTPSAITIPIFAYFRANFMNAQFSPFFALAAGYELGSKQTLNLDLYSVEYNTGGFFANPQIGINYRTTLKTSLYLAIGFQAYTMPYCVEHTGYNATIKQELAYGVDIHLGFTF